MKIHGRVYLEIPALDLEPGDYVMLAGRRVRRVAAVRRQAGGRVVLSLEPMCVGGMVLRRAQRIGIDEVETAWRWHRAEAVGKERNEQEDDSNGNEV